jgi:inosine/xanthosine triphosphate pyrophosphatase family protein
MTVIELKKKLIKEINHTKNNEILEEMYRLISNEEPDNTIYELSNEQIDAVEETQKQFKNGQYLKSKQADKNIDEWLGK